jgi:hypothetical protein
MVVPSEDDMAAALRLDRSQNGVQARLMRERYETTGEWLTAGYFAFEAALVVRGGGFQG